MRNSRFNTLGLEYERRITDCFFYGFPYSCSIKYKYLIIYYNGRAAHVSVVSAKGECVVGY